MTFLFCDIRGFTTISEHFQEDPEDLIALVNRFLTPMTAVIQERRGTIDKYIGDCIMAFWNAPLRDGRHAQNACDAALAVLDALAALNREIADEKELVHVLEGGRLRVGIGINTGPCFVGNMGSKSRFDYSAIGDAVNTAARLESITKTYGVDIVLGEETARRAARYAIVEIDLVAVRGKQQATRVYALLGPPERAEDPAFADLQAVQRALVAAMQARDWSEVDRLLPEARRLAPQLRALHDLYAERVRDGRGAQERATPLPHAADAG
jgi:adenylate cyclase